MTCDKFSPEDDLLVTHVQDNIPCDLIRVRLHLHDIGAAKRARERRKV